MRIALHLKAIAFETVPVHLVQGGGEQHLLPYTSLNPAAQVPLLEWEDGDGVLRRLSQSMAIALMLEEVVPTPQLLSDKPFARAQVIAMAELVNSGIQPLQNLAVLQHIDEQGLDKHAWASRWIKRGLHVLEQMAKGVEGPFLGGARPSLADAFLVPQLYNARRFSIDPVQFPRLLEAEHACQDLPAFKKAHPDAQPDAPAKAD